MSNYHGHNGLRGIFWWFWIYFHAGKWLQINWYFGNYFCEGKRPEIKTISSCTHLPGHIRLAGSLPSGFGLMHTPRVRGIHCLDHLTGSSRTSVVHAQPLSLFLSLHQCNLLPCLIKGRAGSSREAGWFFTLTSPFPPRGRTSFLLQPPAAMASTNYRDLGLSSLSRSFCNPYYKSAQITQQHELDIGCYSAEARTSINPVHPLFAQPSEARHAI
jgi:hypothetical protein